MFCSVFVAFSSVLVISIVGTAVAAEDPLPSWNDGASKQAILGFVAAVTDEGGKDYVEPAERIATFDNDGTLWVEYSMYTQVLHKNLRRARSSPSKFRFL